MDMTRRAYSVLEVKSVANDKRVIRGVATTPAVDRVGDIVEPLGVEFKNPLPLLWQHKHDAPVGTVKFDKPTKDGVTFEAELPQVAEAGALRDRIEEAWQSIKAGLVKAVSIGFRPIEYAFLDEGGIRFIKSEVYELSLVTIPANADAVITAKNFDAEMVSVIKSFDTDAPAATGLDGATHVDAQRWGVAIERALSLPGASGKSTKTVNLKPTENPMAKTLAEQIAALEAKRAANAARMEEILNKSVEEGRSTEADEQEEFDTLEAEVEQIDGDLKRFRSLEKAKVAEARVIRAPSAEDGTSLRDVRAPVKVKAPKLDAGIGFARYAKVKALARIDGESVRTVAKELYGEDSPVYGAVIKAAVAAGTTTDSTWAGPLVGEEGSLFADFVEFLRPQTILGRFGQNGVPGLRSVPFRVRLVSQSSGGEGYWVGEGKSKPLTKFDFGATSLSPLKVANIAVVTEELLRDSSPSAEALVRDQLAAALRARLDVDFINPAKAAVADVSPASILNGVTGIASVGNDADSVRADIQALFGVFITANNAPSSGVWIMTATTALALSLMQNPLGQAEFPGINMNGGTLFGLPVIVSQYVPSGIVALVNASDIYLADEGGISVDMSREASLEMDDAPSHDSDTPTPAELVSMFQTNSVAFRAERTLNWARRRTASVAYLTDVAWGTPAAEDPEV